MRTLSALAALAATLLSAAPARALELDRLLTQFFGSSDPKDLGGPIFALIGVVSVLFFWGAVRIGRRRQRRLIEDYDDQMREYSARLRRGKS